MCHRNNENAKTYNDPIESSQLAIIFTNYEGILPKDITGKIYPKLTVNVKNY